MPALWPPALRPGDRVGVAALSGMVDPAQLARGLAALRELGFAPVPARNLGAEWGILAGADEERLDAFHELIADDSLAAVFFARGGHGLLRLLPRLDWDLVASRPRAWVGYSDLTPFLLQVVERCNLVTFHGPMVSTDLARGLTAGEAASLGAGLAGRGTLRYPLRWLRAGDAEGPLLGGCLSLLTAVLGTPWATRFDGALLFVEDVNEAPYKVDRMLTHLRLSGNLTGVRGILCGHFGAEWEQAIRTRQDDIRSEETGGELIGMGAGTAATPTAASWHLESLLGPPGPVAWSVPCGHGVPNLTLPLGAHGRLDAACRQLEVAGRGI